MRVMVVNAGSSSMKLSLLDGRDGLDGEADRHGIAIAESRPVCRGFSSRSSIGGAGACSGSARCALAASFAETFLA